MIRIGRAVWNELMPRGPVFTTAEVAEAASTALPNASRDLAKLEQMGMITRVRRGLWAITGHPEFSPYEVVPYLVPGEGETYVSFLSALNLHGMIDQIPRVVQVATRAQRSRLDTPVGSFEFHQIQGALFGGFGPYRRTGRFDMASPEKALFDTLYLSARKGRRFAHLPELELPKEFSVEEMEAWMGRVEYRPLRTAVRKRWSKIAGRGTGRVATRRDGA